MTTPATPTQYCYKHPAVETGLRCNRCERPICSRCAVHTETGYRCPDCIRGQQKIFDTARWYDFALALAVSLVLSAIGSTLSTLLGFWVIFIAPAAGIVIAEAVRLVIHRRRNRALNKLVVAAVFIGGLIPGIPNVILLLSGLSTGLGTLSLAGSALSIIVWPLVYVALAASGCYYRLSCIRLR